MESDYPVLDLLRPGCAEVGIDVGASKELVRFLLTKRLLGPEKAQLLSPSSKLDKLLHWVLLNSEVRKGLELSCVGEITHSTQTSKLDDISKCKRR